MEVGRQSREVLPKANVEGGEGVKIICAFTPGLSVCP